MGLSGSCGTLGDRSFQGWAVLIIVMIFAGALYLGFRVDKLNSAQSAQVTQEAKEAGWFTIAEKPIWNDKAQVWEVVCYLGNREDVTSPRILAFCSPMNSTGMQMSLLKRSDKAFLFDPIIHGTPIYLVGSVKTAAEYQRDVPK